ncbi:Mpa43p KNAG_0F00660 [Huiozyma naganishii CBS 8797]|uniref:Carbohydrate kinase FGGY C-terminal domain-containing protein n=1 Tax=Huiozyma naganishii (strain ATCC MYA-139 / BCRC 22969 / CBS 8797 / KCTC 17520 / NBRC 10181 / NCYC 3082 / Yp74L-3) TaxID=1071383 RepID=J7R795_HUIN7|nr:hypothetical protein KNAG_0F00660 [Kazachstania naganishii CBS 8797]CCK70735.1 hypothetical protein KNAG_0F00660 [Kazachstania naganishii CBS 8797]
MVATPIGIGIDLGSSSVRVGIYSLHDDSLLGVFSKPVPYYYESNRTSLWEYTQDSAEILTAIKECFDMADLQKYDVKSCGVAATCSLVLCERSGDDTFQHCEGDSRNVVFWMDSMAKEETNSLNARCPQDILGHMGGGFIPEMGIPKLSRFLKSISDEPKGNIQWEVFDLHKYVAYKLAQEYCWNTERLSNHPNSNGIGHDGELAGWSKSFYDKIVRLPPNVTIGCPKTIENEDSLVIVDSCIDCYSSWFSPLQSLNKNTLFLVAGTSTCYIYSPGTMKTETSVKGIWGPFTDILGANKVVYESGSSCSGKLIEHLFTSHPSAISLNLSTGQLISKLEEEINIWETQNATSIHFEACNNFLYGDLDGNRTPFGDPYMRGMFIGESPDTSFRDLLVKYVCILECLAFQTKLMVDNFEKLNSINELFICGSQAKNTRLLKLISLINDNALILVPKEKEDLMGVEGAYLLGKAGYLGTSVDLVPVSEPREYISVKYTNDSDKIQQTKLYKLLLTKYIIHLEMAEQQQRFRKMVSKALV